MDSSMVLTTNFFADFFFFSVCLLFMSFTLDDIGSALDARRVSCAHINSSATLYILIQIIFATTERVCVCLHRYFNMFK